MVHIWPSLLFSIALPMLPVRCAPSPLSSTKPLQVHLPGARGLLFPLGPSLTRSYLGLAMDNRQILIFFYSSVVFSPFLFSRINFFSAFSGISLSRKFSYSPLSWNTWTHIQLMPLDHWISIPLPYGAPSSPLRLAFWLFLELWPWPIWAKVGPVCYYRGKKI